MDKFVDDFEVQPKVKNGKKQKGGGCSNKTQVGRKKTSSNKKIYNSKHIRIMSQKIERSKSKSKKD